VLHGKLPETEEDGQVSCSL